MCVRGRAAEREAEFGARVVLVVQLDQRLHALDHRHARAFVRARHQQHEFIAADARRDHRLVGHLAEHLARAAQQRVARGVAARVVGRLQAVQVDRDDRDRPGALALEAVQFVLEEGAVAQARQHVVLAEVFEVGLGLLACSDVDEGDLHQPPVFLCAGQHRELQHHVDEVAVERVVDDLALLQQLAVPEVDQLLGEGRLHLVAEHEVELVEQRRLVGRVEHLERALVDVDHADLGHATLDELGVHLREDAEILDAAGAHVVDQRLDRAEILDPERHRRILEQAARVVLGLRTARLGTGAFADVLDRDQHARPVARVRRQHAAVDEDVDALAGQAEVDRLAREAELAVPEAGEFFDDVRLDRRVVKDLVEVGDEVVEIARLEEFERAAVDLQHPDPLRALVNAREVFAQVGAEVGDGGITPLREERAQAAVVLEPERDRREFEHLLEVGRLVAHGRHGASRIKASISSASTGTPRLMSSQPLAVTTASSSMRMPMFQ